MLFKNNFPKFEKLCSPTAISNLFKSNERIYESPFKLIFKKEEIKNKSEIKLLISVPKKKIKKAVHRNKIKRKIREAYRLNKQIIEPLFGSKHNINLAIIYQSDKDLNYQEIERKIILLLQRLEKWYAKSDKFAINSTN